ncbi:MAG: NAD-dependent succinate-semialdehyde dehydrogenase [Gammaproteobacteria bacterium]|nr:NAD-dependent succinate-semialdehyde dehydrogenase [Gammaproteobacteria bacterium]
MLTQINPFTETIEYTVDAHNDSQIQLFLQQADAGFDHWRRLSICNRQEKVQNLAKLLRQNKRQFATSISTGMGKIINESLAEIDKCILTCDYYVEHAEAFLRDEVIGFNDAYVLHQPLGTILGIMPWNFPFWQVFRFAIPTLLAGNTVLLKHASSIPQLAQIIQQIFCDAGFAKTVFRCLLIGADKIEKLISSPVIKGVAITASENTGRIVAALAGHNLKPVLLELGGSDPFIVLEDAPINETVNAAVASRFFTSGQSCINAKRFILTPAITEQFIQSFSQAVKKLKLGDPLDQNTQLGPMARKDLVGLINSQVESSVAEGAKIIATHSNLPSTGFFYPPCILDNVHTGMPAHDEELFGPVATIIRAQDETHAIHIANNTRFGLGASIWSENKQHAKALAKEIDAGMVFINSIVRSDPRMPFGGIKHSGFGRELQRPGIRYFCNHKTLYSE